MEKMIVTKELMMQEALERMKLLKLHPNVAKEFQEDGTLNLSKQSGALYWPKESQLKLIRGWEKITGHLVYHIIHSQTEFGELLNLLYISNDMEEWEQDRADIQENQAFCYVMNITDDWCSEYGTIGIQPLIGGVIRTA